MRKNFMQENFGLIFCPLMCRKSWRTYLHTFGLFPPNPQKCSDAPGTVAELARSQGVVGRVELTLAKSLHFLSPGSSVYGLGPRNVEVGPVKHVHPASGTFWHISCGRLRVRLCNVSKSLARRC